jgi:hypothetical protein
MRSASPCGAEGWTEAASAGPERTEIHELFLWKIIHDANVIERPVFGLKESDLWICISRLILILQIDMPLPMAPNP